MMRILFGPEHDGLHIDPNEPNGYEWWYFDAISDDQRYVLVVIFFLGTPMSPYYKAVVDGKNPLPKDWCGVFVSLHEKTKSGYAERGYAYNVYSENDINLRPHPDWLAVNIAKSRLTASRSTSKSKPKHYWHLSVKEPTLWLGTIDVRVSFITKRLTDGPEIEGDPEHSWACVAPVCKVEGSVRLPGLSGREWISFHGTGYHDHNFGKLPWAQTRSWLWGRGSLTSQSGDTLNAIFYWNHAAAAQATPSQGAFLLLLDEKGRIVHQTSTAYGGDSYAWGKRSGRYGLQSVHGIDLQSEITYADGNTYGNLLEVPMFGSFLSESPFYERGLSQFKLYVDKNGRKVEYTGLGIAEVFEPARLCGPIISRMMWTRIRRRS